MADLLDIPLPPPPAWDGFDAAPSAWGGVEIEPPLPPVWNSVSSELIPLSPPLTHDLLSDGEDEEEAAIVIQKVWRGYQGRKLAKSRVSSIIIIQKYYKGYKARRSYKVLLEQTRWMRDIPPPTTPKPQIITRTKGLTGRKRPTRGVKVQTKEVVDTAPVENDENEDGESIAAPAQPKLVNNGMGMMIPKFDPSAIALKTRGPGMLTKDRPVSVSNPEMLFKLKKTQAAPSSDEADAAANTAEVSFLSGLKKAPPKEQNTAAPANLPPLSFSPMHLRKTVSPLSSSTGDIPKRVSLDLSSLPLPPPPAFGEFPPPPTSNTSAYPPLPPFTPSQLPPPPIPGQLPLPPVSSGQLPPLPNNPMGKPLIPPRPGSGFASSMELPPPPMSVPGVPAIPSRNKLSNSITDLPPPQQQQQQQQQPPPAFIQSQTPPKKQSNGFSTGSHRTSLTQALSPDVLNLPPPPTTIPTPAPLQLKPGWAEYTTTEGKKYYHHQLTNITTWNASDATVPFPLPTHSSAPSLPLPKAQAPTPAPIPTPAPAVNEQWFEHITADGKRYYHERISNITTWSKPPNVQVQTIDAKQQSQPQQQVQQQTQPQQQNSKSPSQSKEKEKITPISKEQKKHVGGILGKFLKRRPTKQELESKNILQSEKASSKKK